MADLRARDCGIPLSRDSYRDITSIIALIYGDSSSSSIGISVEKREIGRPGEDSIADPEGEAGDIMTASGSTARNR